MVKPEQLESRAKELRTLAEEFKDKQVRMSLVKLAEQYEEMAKRRRRAKNPKHK